MAADGNEVRYNRQGAWRKLAEAEGYVMIRRPDAYPIVLTMESWDDMAREPVSKPKRN